MTAELHYFISKYSRTGRPGDVHPPDLQDSLKELARIHADLGTEGRLPPHCQCLIEGYVAPGNAQCLRDYLAAVGVTSVEILAVDLYDLPSEYARLGYQAPPLRFQLADARDLRGVVEEHSVDLVVQDFLVNCVAPGDVPAIFRECARSLTPGGLAFVSFTDDQCMADVETLDPGVCAQPVDIRCQVLVPGNGNGWDRLLGRRFSDPETGAWVFVTPPHGRLEFFAPLSQTLSAITSAGLEILSRTVTRGVDDHGLRCVRHRCILRRFGQEIFVP